MHGNENSTSLYNTRSFPSAHQARNLRQSGAATSCDCLTSAAVSTTQINLLLVSAAFRIAFLCYPLNGFFIWQTSFNSSLTHI